MSMYKFSKSGRLFVQGTREENDRDNVASSSPTGNQATDLQAIYTKRKLSTEVLGTRKSFVGLERIRLMKFNWGINSSIADRLF